ncbi:MAGUK p55 subfamily member 5 [Papilio machaon]|uniref:MAGUK p55 subfamily member 5 n=1 Tax=Papilio machaon TaxID=76193 RepID=A0A0N1IPH9_PAPMA|nr:MAGUK p55 subfamily member 5 [Papilio machaon]
MVSSSPRAQARSQHDVDPERIKAYSEQLRQRKEAEERIAAQNEFLRTSLRGSHKLQALESTPGGTAFINDAYEEDIDEVSPLYTIIDSLRPLAAGGESAALAAELLALLGSLELESLAQAHDQAAVLLDPACFSRSNKHKTGNVDHKNGEKSFASDDASEQIKIIKIEKTNEPLGKTSRNNDRKRTESLAAELLAVLGSLELESLAQAHDQAAVLLDPACFSRSNKHKTGNVDHKNGEKSLASDDTSEQIKIIKIEKTNEPLGATVRNEGEAVIIGRIVRGGAAEKSGLLHEGDELLEVNGVSMRGKSVHEVCQVLGALAGTLTVVLAAAGTRSTQPQRAAHRVLHVRAHFDYDPEDDVYIPCRELGISFQKGDVLHVISRDDPNWWQAFREGEEDQTLAGLIPSQAFQHQRESMKLTLAGEAAARDKPRKGGTLLCAKKPPRKKKAKKATSEAGYPLYSTAAGEDTSRPRKDHEVPGQDYHFISRTQFEADILNRKFVEHGEYEKAYYGTSLEAIREVVSSGKICVLNLHPQSLRLLRASDLKPYTVFVAPPSLEKLRQKKIRNGEAFKEEELKEIIATARDMELRWGHLFDMIIINNDTQRAYQQLLNEINSLEREPQWVPAHWLKQT